MVSYIWIFRPDIAFTFGEEGAYGHPDHVTISNATTEACRLAGDSNQFSEQLPQEKTPHAPSRLYHSHFPQNQLLLMEHLVRWLSSLDARFRGSEDFIQGLTLFVSESSTMGFNSDHISVKWFPFGFYIIEQSEPATSLYLILSGQAEVLSEGGDGTMHKLAEWGPGEFVGEVGLAYGQPRNANVIARESVTCLVFSPDEPTAFAGRGEGAQHTAAEKDTHDGTNGPRLSTCIDVSDYIKQKASAIAAHRTQYRLSLDMFPEATLKEMLGHEYFMRVIPPVQIETKL